MPSLVLRRVSFGYRDQTPVLADVDIHLRPGWTGVVGENGAGKSTLLGLLAGQIGPDSGLVLRDPASLRVSICPQTVESLSDSVVRFSEDDSGLARELRGRLELDPSVLSRWSSLSPGERKRFQIGAALFEAPDVLLLDEPETHLDADARALVRAALARHRGIGIVVAHDRRFLQAMTTSTIRVFRGTARLWSGPYDEARAAWEAEAAHAADVRGRMVSEEKRLARQLSAARQEHAEADAGRSTRRRMKSIHDHDASNSLAKGRANAAEKRAGRVVEVAAKKLERQKERALSIHVEKELGGSIFWGFSMPSARFVFEVQEPEIRAGDAVVLREVKLFVPRGARIRVEGPNGAGKTTLLEALARGARIPRDRLCHLRQDMPLSERRTIVREIKALPPDERGRALSIAAALGLSPDKLHRLSDPSPGEARKLVMALGLGRQVAALLLDEPDNHLDLPSRERLERALVQYPGTIVMVCHDDAFGERVAKTRIRIEGGALLEQ